MQGNPVIAVREDFVPEPTGRKKWFPELVKGLESNPMIFPFTSYKEFIHIELALALVAPFLLLGESSVKYYVALAWAMFFILATSVTSFIAWTIGREDVRK